MQVRSLHESSTSSRVVTLHCCINFSTSSRVVTLPCCVESSTFSRVVTLPYCVESSTIHESSPSIFCQELQLFIFEQFSYFRHNLVYRSKLSDSSCYGKITQSNTPLMKELFRNNVIWMDENSLEVIVSAYNGDLWCQVMAFQVQSYSRHFQHLLSHIYASVLF